MDFAWCFYSLKHLINDTSELPRVTQLNKILGKFLINELPGDSIKLFLPLSTVEIEQHVRS